jgi:hypothetical protein
MTAMQENSEARELIRRFRATYRNLYRLWRGAASRPASAALHTPQERPLTVSELPDQVRRLVAEHQKQHPDRRLTFIKHLRTENGKPVLVVEDDSDLPLENAILTTSQTVTLNTAETLRVITDVFVARID